MRVSYAGGPYGKKVMRVTEMAGRLLRIVSESQTLITTEPGGAVWRRNHWVRRVSPAQVALLICDMWDNHWSRGATERVNSMVPNLDALVRRVREAGVQIVHCPSDTMDFYAGSPARERVRAVSSVPPVERLHDDPPLPIDDRDGGSDTGEAVMRPVWRCQHPGIGIDEDRDGISDDGREVYGFLRNRSRSVVLMTGVHTNMCVLNRSFGIKQLVRWGMDVYLVRDLTDSMYNPARPPYVDHDAGTRLVIGYIEKFWCPTTTTGDIGTE